MFFQSVTVIRNGTEIDIKCQDIIQGDLVKAARDCDVPCDLVLLKSSDPHGKCHITTANLDGETNLKTLMVPKGLPSVSLGKILFVVYHVKGANHYIIGYISPQKNYILWE